MKKRIPALIIVLAVFALFALGSDSDESSDSSVAKPALVADGSQTGNDSGAVDSVKTEMKETPTNTEKKDDGILSGATVSQKNAYQKALSYLGFSAFSHDGLIDQLVYEKFSLEDATWAADNCGADWNNQAVQKAKSYLDFSSFSHDGLVDQLEYEKFTHEQAVYAADQIFGTTSSSESSNAVASDNSNEAMGSSVGQANAAAKAKDYLSFTAFSYSGLIGQLKYEGFTDEEAAYGADNCGADWNEQAVKKAAEYLAFTSFSKQGLIDQLKYDGFTDEQATYGVEQNGF